MSSRPTRDLLRFLTVSTTSTSLPTGRKQNTEATTLVSKRKKNGPNQGSIEHSMSDRGYEKTLGPYKHVSRE